MRSTKTFSPSRHFSFTVLAIGIVSLASALLFARAIGNVRHTDAIAMRNSCSGQLSICMQSAEKSAECNACIESKGTVRTTVCQTCVATKAHCQNEYNVCTDQGGSMHAW